MAETAGTVPSSNGPSTVYVVSCISKTVLSSNNNWRVFVLLWGCTNAASHHLSQSKSSLSAQSRADG